MLLAPPALIANDTDAATCLSKFLIRKRHGHIVALNKSNSIFLENQFSKFGFELSNSELKIRHVEVRHKDLLCNKQPDEIFKSQP